MENNNYSNPFDPKQIEQKTKTRLWKTSIFSILVFIAVLLIVLLVMFPLTTYLPERTGAGEKARLINWNLLEGIASLVTVSLVIGGLAFAFIEYVQTAVQQSRENAETSFNIYKEVYYRIMNPEAMEARRWIILNLPTRNDQEDDQSWLKRTTATLNKRPRGWKNERPPGKEYLKEVLNTLDFLGFVAKHYWSMGNELVTWMSPPVAKVWERIYLYVKQEAEQRNEPHFYESASEFGQYCVEWRNKHYPKSNVIRDAT
jgi:heme/copper-type cytochrome/quinol oxidase subunit 2